MFTKNVLIVDDERTARRTINRWLAREGYRCDEADNTQQALGKLRNTPADLAILDIRMPGKSGMELLSRIRASYPGTAVIMATTLGDTDVIVQCMKQGAQDYICKPFSLDEIIESAQRALEKKSLELRIREFDKYFEQKEGEPAKKRREVLLGYVQAVVNALEARDKYTAGHSHRVCEMAGAIAREMKLSAGEMEEIRWGALLHDVGKVAVDPVIQNKPGKLNKEEYRHVMNHAFIGPDIVRPVVNQKIVDIISHHHDHYDGGGLDQTVTGEGIPLGARIIAVADSYDAMTSDRAYRCALPEDEALAEIERWRGIQFDPWVASAFLKIARDRIAQEQVQAAAATV